MPNRSAKLDAALHRAATVNHFVGDLLDSRSFPAAERLQLSASCLHISLTHQSSIAVLIDHGIAVSAFALLRPQIDAYLRGIWLHRLAPDDALAGILGGDDMPGSRRLMDELERSGRFDPKTLTSVGSAMWPTVCDFTHTGGRSIRSHISGQTIEPNFDEDDVIQVLEASGAWCIMAAVALAGLLDDDDLAYEIYKFSRAQFVQIPNVGTECGG